MRTLTFLGTAAGMPLYSSSTAILVGDETTNLLLDTSGGHNILGALHAASKTPLDIQNIFISHHDSDHILGIIPLVRAFRHDPHHRQRRIFCSQETKAAIDALFTHTAGRHYQDAQQYITFEIVNHGDKRRIDNWNLTFFNLESTKTPQLGCAIRFADETLLSYLGDEPLQEHCIPFVKDSDILLHEAFCTSDTIDTFKPYEKHHGTAKEAGENAIKAHAKKLVLFHMEDMTLATRQEKYAADVRQSGFAGDIFVPKDLDVLPF